MDQHELPALPVPDLCQSIDWYLKGLRPLLGEHEFAEAKTVAEHFCHNDGAALHGKLLEYSRSIAPRSWLMPYSRDIYLTMRDPVTLVGNYLLELALPSFSEKYDYLEFTAILAHSAGQLYLEIVHNTLPAMAHKETPLCMSQFQGAFRATKIPHRNKDRFTFFQDFTEVHSFGVFCKNKFYTIKLIDEDGRIYSADCIRRALQQIYHDKGSHAEASWNVLSLAGSDRAAELIAEICQVPANACSMDIVNQTMFIVTLTSLTSMQQPLADKLYNSTDDIWAYKPWSITVYQNKVCTFNNEHTYMDGVNNVYLINRLLKKMADFAGSFADDGQTAPLTPINFVLSPPIQEQLAAIKAQYQKTASQIDIVRYVRDKLCIGKIKARKLNVDACLQFAFQYAQLKIFKALRTTHESVSVTQYYEGRTACIRSVSEESAQFVAALLNGAPQKQLSDMLAQASCEHVQKIAKAKDFCCFIRHAAGLEIMYERFGRELGIPEKPPLFSDAAFATYCTQYLSTSTLGNTPIVDTFAFAPVAPGGLGIGYVTHNDRLITAISFYRQDNANIVLFQHALDEFFVKLELLLT